MTREEAIKKIKWEIAGLIIDKDVRDALETLIPELHESEDKRIRKGLIEALKTSKTVGELKFVIPEPTREECIAYLEKQKEPENTSVSTMVPSCWDVEQKEQKPAEKPSMLELLREHLANTPKEQLDAEFEELKEFTIPKPAELSEEGEKMIDNIIAELRCHVNYSVPPFLPSGTGIATYKYQKEIDWLKSLRPQPQGTYQRVVHTIFNMLKDRDFYEIQPSNRVSLLNDIRVKCKDAIECAPILDEPHWKPSEEQMKALYSALNNANDAISLYSNKVFPLYEEISRKRFDTLESLYNELKKLM